jgi:phage I-like protein
MSYLVDLSTVVLDEGATPSSWIHAMTKGKYDHPVYGEINFTNERLKGFAESVVKKVRGIDPDIDYDHKARSGEAAGWVKNAEVRDDGLYLFVEWTTDAVQKIKSKAYRYFSPEFLDEWTDPKTTTVIPDVIAGGAITNRPFLKDLAPLNLSEMLNPDEDPEEEGNKMDPKKFAELLGLAEGASEEDMLAKIKEFKDKAAKPPITLSDADAELKKLAETNPAIKLLMDQQQQLREDNAKTTATLRLAEVRNSVTQLGEDLRPKGVALPAASIETLTKVLHETPDHIGKAVVDMVKALGETGFVELGEKGRARTTADTDPVKVFSELVVKAQTDHKLSYVDAVSKVALENPDAYRDYAGASYAVQPGGDK